MNNICINSSSSKDIQEWLNEINTQFMPPLENFVEFHMYANKIFNNARRFELYKNGMLTGLLAAYINKERKMAFVTIFGIAKEDRTISNIRQLFISFLIDFLTDPSMEYVELEVHHLNKPLLRFYNKLNFKIKETREHSYIFEASRSQCIFLSS